MSDRRNDVARKFIERTPFVSIATKPSEGLIDISQKWGPSGVVEVCGDKTPIIPDRLGNLRVEGFHILIEAPDTALLFIVPGHGDTLRVAGKARILPDAAINKQYAITKRREP